MTVRFRRVDREGPVPPGLEILHLSCCEQCALWERSHYRFVGTCRRHPYPRMHAWDKCGYWTNRHRPRSFLDDFIAG